MNPRAAVNDLHPFQGCPFGQLGYFSEYITNINLLFKNLQTQLLFLMSGEDGIRTHVPLRTNGFQDRLVMTTSIPLRVLHFISARFILSSEFFCVNYFFYFF